MDLDNSIIALGLLGLIVWLLWRFRGNDSTAYAQGSDSFSPDLNSGSSVATTAEPPSQVKWGLLALPIGMFEDAAGVLAFDIPDGTYVKDGGHYFQVSHHDAQGHPILDLVDSSLFQN